MKVLVCTFFWPIFTLYITTHFICRLAYAINKSIIFWINCGRVPVSSDENQGCPKLTAANIHVTTTNK